MLSKSDGKLVQFDNPSSQAAVSKLEFGLINEWLFFQIEAEEKVDAVTLEYTYLLTNQLESQRLYFEEKLETVESLLGSKVRFRFWVF